MEEDSLCEMLKYSSLKDYWVEEDFKKISEYLEYYIDQEYVMYDRILKFCKLFTVKDKCMLHGALTYIYSKDCEYLLFEHVKKWLPNPSFKQWSRIITLNKDYINIIYDKL